MLNATDLILIRSWLQGLSWATMDEFYADDDLPLPSKHIKIKLHELMIKARFNNRPQFIPIFQQPPKGSFDMNKMIQLFRDVDALPYPAPEKQQLIEHWLPDNISKYLNKANLKTLSDLASLKISAPNWHTQVTGLTIQTASFIDQWFQDYPDLLEGLSVKAKKTEAARKAIFAIVPLDYLSLPDEFLGSPSDESMLTAKNDLEAIRQWLSSFESSTTQAYTKEIERLLLWSVHMRKKSLSKLSDDDLLAYRDFLRQPQPRNLWVTPLSKKRTDKHWKPFVLIADKEGLSEVSIHHAETILRQFMQWLTDFRYIAHNSYRHIDKLSLTVKPKISHDKTIGFVYQALSLSCQNAAEEKKRLKRKLIFDLLRFMNLGLQDIVSLTAKDIMIVNFKPASLNLYHKTVEIPSSMQDDFSRYLSLHQLRDTRNIGHVPLISKERQTLKDPHLTVRGLQKIIDRTLHDIANNCLDDGMRQQIMAISVADIKRSL